MELHILSSSKCEEMDSLHCWPCFKEWHFFCARVWEFLIFTPPFLIFPGFNETLGIPYFTFSDQYIRFFIFLIVFIFLCFAFFLFFFWLKIWSANFLSFLLKTGPRECHNRILRKKLYRVHQFSSKLAPGKHVLWLFHFWPPAPLMCVHARRGSDNIHRNGG